MKHEVYFALKFVLIQQKGPSLARVQYQLSTTIAPCLNCYFLLETKLTVFSNDKISSITELCMERKAQTQLLEHVNAKNEHFMCQSEHYSVRLDNLQKFKTLILRVIAT